MKTVGSAGRGLMLVLPVPFRQSGDGLLFESQACNGLARWADNFDRVTVAAPVLRDSAQVIEGMVWEPLANLACFDRLDLVPLPYAYTLLVFLATLHATRALLRRKILDARYLSFAIGGLVGDWASVACLEARRVGKPYSVWTDRVEYDVVRVDAAHAPLKRRVKAWASAPLMRRYQRHLVSHASLGLFHGRDCFDAYAPFCAEPHLVHNVHTKPRDHIGDAELEAKVRDAGEGPLRVCYVGRASPTKGPLDWVRAVARATELGADVRATWFGSGPQLADAEALAKRLCVADRVAFAGFVADRAAVLAALRGHHALVFCHKTPESPRCLVESLVCGTPLVGYRSAYAQDLVSDGGGELVRDQSPARLGETLAGLSRDRARLQQMIRDAAHTGRRFSDELVFRHRGELIKRYLP